MYNVLILFIPKLGASSKIPVFSPVVLSLVFFWRFLLLPICLLLPFRHKHIYHDLRAIPSQALYHDLRAIPHLFFPFLPPKVSGQSFGYFTLSPLSAHLLRPRCFRDNWIIYALAEKHKETQARLHGLWIVYSRKPVFLSTESITQKTPSKNIEKYHRPLNSNTAM